MHAKRECDECVYDAQKFHTVIYTARTIFKNTGDELQNARVSRTRMPEV